VQIAGLPPLSRLFRWTFGRSRLMRLRQWDPRCCKFIWRNRSGAQVFLRHIPGGRLDIDAPCINAKRFAAKSAQHAPDCEVDLPTEVFSLEVRRVLS
jgi:hypothetical protein